MRALSFLLFAISCVLCRPNSEGNVVQRDTTTPTIPNNTIGENLVYPNSQNEHPTTLNEPLVSLPHTWNPFGRNGFMAPIYPGQIGYPPITVPTFLIPAPTPPPPPPIFLPHSPPLVGIRAPYPAVGGPILELFPPQSVGSVFGQPLLFPPGTVRGPYGGYYIPVTTTTTITEEVTN